LEGLVEKLKWEVDGFKVRAELTEALIHGLREDLTVANREKREADVIYRGENDGLMEQLESLMALKAEQEDKIKILDENLEIARSDVYEIEKVCMENEERLNAQIGDLRMQLKETCRHV